MRKKIEQKLKIPDGINVSVDNNIISIKGEKEELSREFKDPLVKITTKEGEIFITSDNASKKEKARIGAYKAHILNMFKGVVEGHHYKLKICAGHFPMNVSVDKNKLVIKNFLGEKIPREVIINEKAKVSVEGQIILVESSNKEIGGQTAANIEQACRITNKDRRIFQDGIYIIEKDGKEIK